MSPVILLFGILAIGAVGSLTTLLIITSVNAKARLQQLEAERRRNAIDPHREEQ